MTSVAYRVRACYQPIPELPATREANKLRAEFMNMVQQSTDFDAPNVRFGRTAAPWNLGMLMSGGLCVIIRMKASSLKPQTKGDWSCSKSQRPRLKRSLR